MDYKHKWKQAMSYEEYRELMSRMVEEGKTTGHDQSQELIDFSKLNAQRMKRIGKTYQPNLNSMQENNLSEKVIFLSITESWCGDAAQALPVVAKIADELQIDHGYILRDDNSDLMSMHLSNGMQSIPVVIVLDKETFQVLGQWGARPEGASQIMTEWKSHPEPKVSKEDVKTQIQIWYNKDKQASIQQEIVEVLEQV